MDFFCFVAHELELIFDLTWTESFNGEKALEGTVVRHQNFFDISTVNGF